MGLYLHISGRNLLDIIFTVNISFHVLDIWRLKNWCVTVGFGSILWMIKLSTTSLLYNDLLMFFVHTETPMKAKHDMARNGTFLKYI